MISRVGLIPEKEHRADFIQFKDNLNWAGLMPKHSAVIKQFEAKGLTILKNSSTSEIFGASIPFPLLRLITTATTVLTHDF